jgi:DNA-binding CsgD family transcriptional regulator
MKVKDNRILIQNIVHKRALPGLLLLDMQGNISFSNSIARQFLQLEPTQRQILEKLRNDLIKLTKTRRRGKDQPEEAEAIIESVVSASTHCWYALRAFTLSQGHQPSPLMAVLVEKIDLKRSARLDLLKARQVFKLTPREIEVIEILHGGVTDKQIASVLGVSTQTVRGYMKIIRAKLGVSTRTAILFKLLSL